MVLIKILKRKDASSVLVAILIAMSISQPLNIVTGPLAGKIVNTHNGPFSYGPNGGWKNDYLFPVVWAILQLVILEILGWIFVLSNRPLKRKR